MVDVYKRQLDKSIASLDEIPEDVMEEIKKEGQGDYIKEIRLGIARCIFYNVYKIC